MDLIPISEADFNIKIDPKYATNDNFTGKAVYRATAKCYLHKEAAECLKKAVAIALPLGLKLLTLQQGMKVNLKTSCPIDHDFLTKSWFATDHMEVSAFIEDIEGHA